MEEYLRNIDIKKQFNIPNDPYVPRTFVVLF